MLHESNLWGSEQDTGIPRTEYIAKLTRVGGMKEVISLVGVRRCGKSTLSKQFLRHVIEKGGKEERTLYINFEEPLFSPHLNRILWIWFITPTGKW